MKYMPSAALTVVECIVEEARYFSADLIVLDGYEHSRIREWIFGGVTHDIQTKTEIPIPFSR